MPSEGGGTSQTHVSFFISPNVISSRGPLLHPIMPTDRNHRLGRGKGCQTVDGFTPSRQKVGLGTNGVSPPRDKKSGALLTFDAANKSSLQPTGPDYSSVCSQVWSWHVVPPWHIVSNVQVSACHSANLEANFRRNGAPGTSKTAGVCGLVRRHGQYPAPAYFLGVLSGKWIEPTGDSGG